MAVALYCFAVGRRPDGGACGWRG